MPPFFQNFSRWERIRRYIRAADFPTMIFSLAVGASIWFYVNARRTTSREISVPVEIELPSGWELQNEAPSERTVVIYGSQQLMQTLSPNDARFHIRVNAPDNEDAAISSKTVDLRLTRENISGLPGDLEITAIRNPELTVPLVKQVRRYLPVELTLTDSLPTGYVMRGYQLSPQYVPVTAPEKSFAPGQVVKTRPLNLSDRKKSFVDYVDLAPLTLTDRTFNLSNSIFVQFSISESLAQRTLANVPVEILAKADRQAFAGKISPARVSVKIEGAEQTINVLSPAQIMVYIDRRDLSDSETRQLKIQAISQDAFKILEITPAEVLWTPENAETPPSTLAPDN